MTAQPAQPPSDYLAVFRSLPVPALVMDTDLVIRAANDAFLVMLERDLAELVGRGAFEAFPANPGHPEGDGVTNLRASLSHVLATREAHDMGVQRYDVIRDGAFVERYWIPTNNPILDADGELVGILHLVEDVTDLHDELTAAQEFYRAEVRAQGIDDAGAHRRFAEYARIAVSSTRRYAEVAAEVEQLREALRSLATIEQAKGIVMRERGCGPEAAFATLVDASQRRNVKVRALAATLVAQIDREVILAPKGPAPAPDVRADA